MWLIPAVILLPLIVNLLQWRRDRRRIHRLAATRKAIPSLAAISGDPPRVSFLVAAWNEEAAIRPCIEAILRLSYRKLEVVLCAGGSDRTREISPILSCDEETVTGIPSTPRWGERREALEDNGGVLERAAEGVGCATARLPMA